MSEQLDFDRPRVSGRLFLVVLAIAFALILLLTTQATSPPFERNLTLKSEVVHQWRICDAREGRFTLGWDDAAHTSSQSRCLGGPLDGRSCTVTPDGATCTWRLGPESPSFPDASEPVLLP